MSDKELSPKRALFVKEYLVDLNGTQAAIRAGYSESGAQVQASRLLSNDMVLAEVNKGIEERNKRVHMTMDDVLREYKCLALFDIRKAFNEDGSLKGIHEIDDDTAAALSSIESDELFSGGEERKKIGYTRRIKSYDKRAALQDITRHLGGFEKDNKQVANAGNVAIVADISDMSNDDKMKILQNIL